MSTKCVSKTSTRTKASKTSTMKSQQSQRATTNNTPPKTVESTHTQHDPSRTDSRMSCKSEPVGSKAGKANGAVYALIRFQSENMGVMRNSCIKQRTIIQNFSFEGEVIGITEHVHPICGCINGTTDKCGMLMLKFKDADSATRWFHSDGVFRQDDFPRPNGSVGMAVFPVRYIPPIVGKDSDGKRTFELVEMRNIRDNGRLQSDYIDKMAHFMDACNLPHGVVATSDVSTPKSTWLSSGSYVVLHEYASPEEFENCRQKGEYKDITAEGQRQCCLSSLMFTVDPKISLMK